MGGGISVPFEKLFDLRGGIKRQRIQVAIAELRKQEAYETLKTQIDHLYVQILSNIETLQLSLIHSYSTLEFKFILKTIQNSFSSQHITIFYLKYGIIKMCIRDRKNTYSAENSLMRCSSLNRQINNVLFFSATIYPSSPCTTNLFSCVV